MIPKKIHYIWLSNDPLPKLPQICIDSWKRHCPDYEIVHWDMEKSRSVIDSVPFVREAVEQSKWAFASDYIRLYALYQEGGVSAVYNRAFFKDDLIIILVSHETKGVGIDCSHLVF